MPERRFNRNRRVWRKLGAAAVLLIAPATLPAQEVVSFPTSDGGIVFGDLYGDGVDGVILAPGGRFNKSSWTVQARVLAEAGFRVLAIDFRGRGESRVGRSGSDALSLDVLAAARYLREIGANQIAVVGASLGGWAAGEAAVESITATSIEISRLVLLAHSPIRQPERLPGRKLFIVSRGDTSGTGASRLEAIRAQYEAAPEPKALMVVEGNAHAQLLFQETEGEKVMSEILRFLLAR